MAVKGTVTILNNSVGVIGVAPEVDLFAIKVLDQYGNGSYSDVIAGIEWAVTNNLNIVNMSFGGNSGSHTLQKTVDNAFNSGVLLVASAGNNAKYDSVIAVGAVDLQNERGSFSSVGRELELMALGVTIKSTIPGGYSTYKGTSMAAPHVAGAAALLWGDKTEFNNEQVRNALNETANNLGDSFYFGNGLVDAKAAISYSPETVKIGGNGKKK
jgi:subtilisin